MIIEGMVRGGMDTTTARIRLGSIASLGVLAYAIGKFPSGALADFLGSAAKCRVVDRSARRDSASVSRT
jgi:hypothetical protein